MKKFLSVATVLSGIVMTSSVNSNAWWIFSRSKEDKKPTTIVSCTKADVYNKELEGSDTCNPLSEKDANVYHNGYYIELSRNSDNTKKKLAIKENVSNFYNLPSYFGYNRAYRCEASWYLNDGVDDESLIDSAKNYIDLDKKGKKIAIDHVKSRESWNDNSWNEYVSILKKKNGCAKKMNARQDCGTWVFFEKSNGNRFETLFED